MTADTPIHGSPVSPGIVMGTAHVVERGIPDTPEYCITAEHIEAEKVRLSLAVDSSRQQLLRLRERLARESGLQEPLYILDAHLLILADQLLLDGAMSFIERECCNAEWAMKRHLGQIIDVFMGMQEPYLREKRRDIEQVGGRILGNLMGGVTEVFSTFPHPVILVAEDFTPSDTASMDPSTVMGFVTEFGGQTSHTAIMAKSLEIPAIVGAGGVLAEVESGDDLILDGLEGRLFVNPDPEIRHWYEAKREAYSDFRSRLVAEAPRPAMTREGVRIQVAANLEWSGDAQRAYALGADGIGLFRSENLFMSDLEPPSEERQVATYREVLSAMGGHLVTIRTLDAGGERRRGCPEEGLHGAANPALGLRGIRLSLKEQTLFRVQIRALLRAAVEGPLRVLLPMVTSSEEVRRVREWVARISLELTREGIAHVPSPPIGAMVEVPAAALCARAIAQEADFLSIGTNDLIQYTLATDRLDESVAHLFNPLHPAILRLIQLTVQAGEEAGVPVSLCGEMAGDPRYTPLLIGLGLTTLSVSPASLPLIRKVVRGLSRQAAVAVTQEVMTLSEPATVAGILDGFFRKHFEPGFLFH